MGEARCHVGTAKVRAMYMNTCPLPQKPGDRYHAITAMELDGFHALILAAMAVGLDRRFAE